MAHCFRCNAHEVKTLADHKPGCPVVKEKTEAARRIANVAKKYRGRNKPSDPDSHGHVNRPGTCKKCGEPVANLLLHLGRCKPKTDAAPDAA